MGHKRVEQERNKVNNLVAKHARKFNLAHQFEDRKRAAKHGKIKHKGKSYE